MPWLSFTFFLLFLLCNAGLIFYGIKNPKAILYLAVATVSWINFSFFSSEVLSRIALFDLLLCVFALSLIIRRPISAPEPFSLPQTPFLIFLLLMNAVALSLIQPAWDRSMIWGEGQPVQILFALFIFLLFITNLKTKKDLEYLLRAWFFAALFAVTLAGFDMSDFFAPSDTLKYDEEGFWGLEDLFSENLFPHPFLSAYSFRIQGSFRTPGQLSAFAATSVIAMAAFAFMPGVKKGWKRAAAALIPPLILCCFLSARASTFTSLLIIATLYFFYFASIKSKKNLIAVIIAAPLLLVACLFLVKHPVVYTFIINRNINDYLQIFQGKSFYDEQLRTVFQIFREHPILGIGLGRFITSDYHVYIRGFELHSMLFVFIAETGILGTAAYCLLMGYFIRKAYLSFKAARNTEWQNFFAVLFWGLMGILPSYIYNRHLRERTFWLLMTILYISSHLIAAYKANEKRAKNLSSTPKLPV